MLLTQRKNPEYRMKRLEITSCLVRLTIMRSDARKETSSKSRVFLRPSQLRKNNCCASDKKQNLSNILSLHLIPPSFFIVKPWIYIEIFLNGGAQVKPVRWLGILAACILAVLDDESPTSSKGPKPLELPGNILQASSLGGIYDRVYSPVDC